MSEILNSSLFDRECEDESAFKMLDEFTGRLENLQNQAEDLKQLQELLDSNIVDFSQLVKAKSTIFYLRLTWKTIKFALEYQF